MKRAIVIGATGGTGEAITRELVKQGIHTIALGRSRSKLEQLEGSSVHQHVWRWYLVTQCILMI